VVGAFLLAALWAGAFAWGNSPPGRRFIKERAVRALRGRIGPVEVGEAGLDLLLRARLSPVTILGKDPGAPILRADRVVVRPRLLALIAGRVEPAAVALRGVWLRPGPGDSEVGPFDLFVEFPGADEVRFRAGLAAGGHLDGSARRTLDGVTFRCEGAVSLPDDLPPSIAARLPFLPASGRVSLRASGQGAPDGSRGEVDLALRATELAFAGPRVGPSPLGPLAAAASGRVEWSGAERRVRLRDGRFTIGESGEAAASVEGEVVLRDDPRFSISARAESVPWRALVDALPPDLGPPPTAPTVSGTLSARASAAGSLARRDGWDVQVDLDLDDLRRAARAGRPSWLSSGFDWTPIDGPPGEPARRILVGPGNPAFVPYAEIPQVLVRAVTASEDAGFFGHRGFDFREIANAVTDRTRVRGASTITQQLSKNLFLSPERTMARKVREALGTIALEASLSKGRLIEIYLNIAEWGPGVHGVGEAARFWFGKDARTLTARESAFLATVVPSPRRFHSRLHRSGLTPWWNARIDDVLGKMRVQNQLTDDQLAAALAEPLDPLGREHPFDASPDASPEDGAPGEPGPEEEPGSEEPYLSR
jgi:hypothetical protein